MNNFFTVAPPSPSRERSPYNQRLEESTQPDSQYTASSLFSSLKGGAAKLVSNVKDVSKTVMDTVSS